MTDQAFCKMIQLRLEDELFARIRERADLSGTSPATWARMTILSRLRSPKLPAEVPKRLTGQERLTIRFRVADFKSIEAARRTTRWNRSDFLRGILAGAMR